MFIRRDKGEISSEEQALLPLSLSLSPRLTSSHSLPPNHRWRARDEWDFYFHRGRSRINMKFEVPSFPILRGTSTQAEDLFRPKPVHFFNRLPAKLPPSLEKLYPPREFELRKRKILREKNESSIL